MPLLGKKPFVCSKPLSDIKPDETIFIVPHTKEQFKSKQYPCKTITCSNSIWRPALNASLHIILYVLKIKRWYFKMTLGVFYIKFEITFCLIHCLVYRLQDHVACFPPPELDYVYSLYPVP